MPGAIGGRIGAGTDCELHSFAETGREKVWREPGKTDKVRINNPKPIERMNMQKTVHVLLVTLACSTLCAAEPQWMTDVPTALSRAKTEKKMVLLDFTGSDWCSWCIKFKKEALSRPEFSQYAAKNLVLVELDFPHNRPLSPALKKANKALQEKYNVDGFPTFVVLNDQGKEIGRQVGYAEGGAKAFIAKLEKLKGK